MGSSPLLTHSSAGSVGLLVLSRDSVHGNHEVLKGSLRRSLLQWLAVHESVELLRFRHDNVGTTKDTEDTERPDPHSDNSDDVVPVLRPPSEQGEHGGNDIDNQDGTRQLPRWNGGPEWTGGSGNENQPVLSQGDLQEQDTVDGTEVPLDWLLVEWSVIVSNGKSSNVGKDGNEDNQVDVQRLVQNGNPQTKEDLQVQRQSNTVDNVGVHSVENLSGSLQGVNDGRKTWSKENDIGSRSGRVRGTFDGNTSVGLLKRWGVVDTVTSHGNQVTSLLQNLNDIVLVLREDLSETVSVLNKVKQLGSRQVSSSGKSQSVGIENVGTKTQLSAGLLGNTNSVTSKHLDSQTELLSLVNSLSSVISRRVHTWHDTENLPVALTSLSGNTQRSETSGSKLGNLVFVLLENVLWDRVVFLDGLQNEQWSTFDTDDSLTFWGLDVCSDFLGNWVEWLELEHLVLGQSGSGSWVVDQGFEEGLVDGIKTLLLSGSSKTGSKHQVIWLNALDGVRLVQRKLVLGQGTGLVGTQDLDTGKRLDSRQFLDNGLLLGQVSSTDGHGSGDDGWKTDWHTNNGDGKGVSEDSDDLCGSVEGRSPDNQQSDNDQDEQGGTDTVQHLGEVTLTTRGLVDQSSSSTNEGGITGGSNNHQSLTSLDSGRREGWVSRSLVDGQRLTGKGGLVNLQETLIRNKLTVGRNNNTVFQLQNVTWNNLRSSNFNRVAISDDGGSVCQRLLQLVDNRTGLVLLDETDTGVQHQQTTDNTEIDPVLETGSQNGSSLHDELDRTDKEHTELEHEVLLFLGHLVRTKLLSSFGNLLGGQTNLWVGSQQLLGNDFEGRVVLHLVLLIAVVGTVVGLQFHHQLVDVLFLFIIFLKRDFLLGWFSCRHDESLF
ncbi:hypothetical protein OGATHE_001864 [Ogataea polymorpha]|uniref:Uncharacterized protein n=1 Tax=Ogataea polymorpha TaxID=460523 RepID=A0A9P8PM04_9ASCO|nr:hypothetical protein OGATHE_001864 [Ogataea polymorpha]